MRIKEILKPIIFVLFLLLAFSGVALGACENNNLIEELSTVDVFHPPADSSMMPLYNEWHYFNVIDEEQNLSIICTFKLNGAFNSSSVLLGYDTGDENSNASFGTYPIGIAEYSSQTPNVTIANSTVRLTPEGYSVHVESDDGSTVFDALFKPEVEPTPVFNASGFSTVPGEVINWIVASSKMKVNGELFVNGKEYTLKNVRGYHDHNWGYWQWGDDLGWDWGQVIQTMNCSNGNDIGEYSLNFGNITDAGHTQSLRSVLNVWKNREIAATFNDKDIQIKHSNFIYVNEPVPIPYLGAYMPAGSFPLPLKTDILVSSGCGDYLNIEFTNKPEHSVPLPVSVPTVDENENVIIKYRVIWEMIGTYQVNGEIDGKPVSYVADGFMEYVTGDSVSPVSQ